MSDVLLERALVAIGALDKRHTPGGHPHNQQDHAGGGAVGLAKKAVKAAAKMGQAALDAAPAHLVGDGLGTLHPDHKRGTIGWSSGDPGWSAEKSERHVAAMEGYRGSDFDGVNKSLRGLPFTPIHQDDAGLGDEGFRQRIADQIELLDGVMEHSRLTDDITVIRGTSTGRGIFGDALAGDLTDFEWTEGAYVSTTANPAIAEYFTISGLILNIHAPEGTGAMALSVMTRNGRDDEAEVLLERGLRMRVVSDTGPGVPRTLEVEVVPDNSASTSRSEQRAAGVSAVRPKAMKPGANLLARMSMEPSDYPAPGGKKVSRAQLREVVAREVEALLRGDIDDDPIGELDDDTVILIMALDELSQELAGEGRAWNPELHKRWPKGHPRAGKFRPMVDMLKLAIANHDGVGHPFDNFKRPQLLKAAKVRGIVLKRGESEDSIKAKLLADLGGKPAGPAAKKAAQKATPAAPAQQPGTVTVLGTKFTPAMRKALTDIEDSGGMQKQRSDFQLEYDLSDDEMDRLVDDGFVEVDDKAGGGGFIGITPRGEKALAELANPAKKAAHGGKAAPAKAAVPAKKAMPKAATAKPKAGSKVGDILTGDFSSLKKVEDGAGTTPAGIYEAADGSRWYVKAQKSADHANNEALASALYRAAGIDVPAVMRGKGAPGLSGENQTATRMVDGAQTNLAFKLSDDAYINKIREGFAVDAWLANWDVVGEGSEHPWANIVEGADGRPHRIDVGGALLFRGMGKEKGDRFGPQVVEFDTMRDVNKGRRHVQVFTDMTDHQVKESVDRVKAITPAQIRKLVADHGMDPALADLLIARRKDLLSRVGVGKPAKGWKGAATGEASLDAAPVKITSSKSGTRGLLEQFGLDSDTAHWAANGFEEYQDGKYGDMNRALLDAAGGDLRAGSYQGMHDDDINMVEAMDRAMQVSKLTKDVIIFRGERAPARSFPPGTWSLTGGMEGMEWTWHPFGSSSADSDVAQQFAVGPTSAPKDQAQPTVMRILVRKGTPAIHLQGDMPSEQELLLGRSLKYRVVKDYGVEDGLVRRIDVEVVPA